MSDITKVLQEMRDKKHREETGRLIDDADSQRWANRIEAEMSEVVAHFPEGFPDEEKKAIKILTAAMIKKLHKKYLEGYSGFEDCTSTHLSNLLHSHIKKGDPVDVANFCAFLLYNGQLIQQSDAQSQIDKLSRELDEVRKDAERYRYIRSSELSTTEVQDILEIIAADESEYLDNAIDAALSKEKP